MIECIGEGAGSQFASLTTQGLAKAHWRGEVKEIYALFLQPEPVLATKVSLLVRARMDCARSVAQSSATAAETAWRRSFSINASSVQTIPACSKCFSFVC
jgi:hypothetical protein